MGRTPCCDKANVKKGPWSPEEDAKLKDFIEKYGTGGNWIALPQKAGLRRCGKSCRLRWLNYLRPNIKHGDFSEEEDRIICRLYDQIRTKWSVIAAHLPGRTDNDIKNYWNTKLKKKYMAAVTNNNNININMNMNILNSPSQFFQAPQFLNQYYQPNFSSLLYKDYYSPSLTMDTLSLPDNPTQTLPINTSYHQSLVHYNPLITENRGFGLTYGNAVADHHQALSSGSSGGSFMSQITQDHNMVTGQPQTYSSSSNTVTKQAGVFENSYNSVMQLDYGIMGGGVNTSPIMQSYDNLEEIKPVINNNISYLGLDDGNKKNYEREEMYYPSY